MFGLGPRKKSLTLPFLTLSLTRQKNMFMLTYFIFSWSSAIQIWENAFLQSCLCIVFLFVFILVQKKCIIQMYSCVIKHLKLVIYNLICSYHIPV